MNRKSKLMLATLVILAILIAPMFYVPTLGSEPGQFDPDWHDVVYGVLEDDYYDLYPYGDHSLDVGFSKWGELIGIDSVLHPAPEEQEEESWVGLRYCGVRDPFAGNPLVPMTRWLNGWFIDIEYVYKGPLPAGVPRNRWIWAFAMFADGLQWGFDWNNWIPVPTPGLGGRQTNKYCETEDMKVLYHGPRRFVAEFVSHIYDGEVGLEPWPVVDLIITLIFNKDKKQVILLKDVKITIPAKNLKGKLDVELSNREQWDLGPDPDKASYAHLYHQKFETTYGDEWHVADNILRPYWGEAHGDGSTRIFSLPKDGPDPGPEPDFTYRGSYPLPGRMARDFDLVWIDREPYTEWPEIDWEEMEKPDDYDIDYATGMITFKTPPPSSARIIVKCKYIEKDYFPHEYDLAQMISRDMLYVGWAAFWPVLSEYTVDGWDVALEKLVNVTVTDLAIEPETPFVIGQWDFLLDHIDIPHYRCVEVKGVTDLWDGDDGDIGRGHSNVPDREVMYQLDEIFDPWDIWSAVHKDTKRWVEFFTGNGISTVFELPPEKEVEVGLWIPTLPVVGVNLDWDYIWPDANSWDRYSTFAERIMVNGELQVPLREVPPHAATTYSYSIDPYAGVIKFVTPPPVDAVIKVLWSSPHWETKAEQWSPEEAAGRTEFPLHHDILPGWEQYMEVFFVEQPPEWVEVAFDDSDLIKTTEQLYGPGGTIPAGTTFDLKIPFVEAVGAVYRDGVTLVEKTHYEVSYGEWTRIRTKVDITLGRLEYLYVNYTYWTLATIKIPPEWLCKELDIKYRIQWRGMRGLFEEEKFHLSPRPIDLAFLIDTTGSMGKELKLFQAEVTGILDAACEASADDIRVSLVTIMNDVTVRQDWTTDVGAVESAILGLSAAGDAAEPEAWDEALNTAVNELFERVNQTGDFSAWRAHAKKIIIIVTDAPPGGFDDIYQPTDLANAKKHADEAAAKGIRILSIDGEDGIPPGTPVEPECTEGLQYCAAVTGGMYINISLTPPAEAFKHMLDGLLTFTLRYPADKIDKSWIHSEKALPLDYWNITETYACDWLVLQQPVPKGVELKVVFKVPSGRYEWVVVGRDSRAVDSAGAAMVAAAFKNKNMEIGLGGLDMQETLKEWGPAVPFIMRILRPEFSMHEEKPGYFEWSKECYRDDNFGPCSGRTALKDDWCETWPISSSNIITLGSSHANLATEYFNEFTEAYLDVYTGDIVALTCWSKNTFKPTFVGEDETVGYAVIATYKDLNGTVGLTIWGWTGQDTYFASKWFDEYKFVLQHINLHVTAIVLEITYVSDGEVVHPPSAEPIELLGTFSEKPPHPDP